MTGRALVGIGGAHFDLVIVDVVAVVVMQMTVMKVTRVAIVLDGRMAAVRAVLMAVRTRMLLMTL